VLSATAPKALTVAFRISILLAIANCVGVVDPGTVPTFHGVWYLS
jgi:hypothetical protein